jgi:hypothetical protein
MIKVNPSRMEKNMSEPIISVWMSRPLPGLSALPQAEQNRIMGQLEQTLADVGGKRIVSCRSEWSSERWLYFGAEVYPDAQALMKFKRQLADMGWYNYLDSQILLGTAQGPVEPAVAGSSGVFKLWMGRPTLAYYQLDEKNVAASMARQQAAFTQVGGKVLVSGGCFSSEHYLGFGIEYFPSLDAVREYAGALWEMKWHQYIEADVLLGTLWE